MMDKLQKQFEKDYADERGLPYFAIICLRRTFGYFRDYVKWLEKRNNRILKLIDDEFEKMKNDLLELMKDEPTFKEIGLRYIGSLSIFKDELKQKIEEGK